MNIARYLVWTGLVGWLSLGCTHSEPPAGADPFAGLDDVVLMQGQGPQVKQAPQAVADDPVANAFITKFVRAGLEGNYTQYRLLTSTFSDPASRDDFRRAWQAVEGIEIIKVVKRDPSAEVGRPEAGGGGIRGGYEVSLRATLRPDVPLVAGHRDRIIRLFIVREPPKGEYRARPLGSSAFIPEETPAEP